jgi:hypothetical protein
MIAIPFALIGTAGCGRYTRIKQCRALIAQVNPTLDEIARLTQTPPDKSTYVAAAARYEQLAKNLGPLEFSSEQMAKDVAEYAGLLRSAAQALRTLPDAKPAELDKANRELERISTHERASITKMDAWCQPSGA